MATRGPAFVLVRAFASICLAGVGGLVRRLDWPGRARIG
jgi:hypothetical protein